MMKKIAKSLLIVNLIFILKSCFSPKYQSEAFVGVWRANDGAIIVFAKDNTFVAENVDFFKLYYPDDDFKNKRLDFKGNWLIVERGNRKVLELSSDLTYDKFKIKKTYVKDGVVFSHKLGVSFEINGKGIFRDKSPKEIFVWIGDPDDLKKYFFVKDQ